MTLGDKIRKYRTLKGLTQAQLGSMVKLTGDRIRQYENDVRKPKEGKLIEIAEALEINPTTLFEPDYNNPNSVMHTFFELEDIYGMRFEKVGDVYQLVFAEGEGYTNASWIKDGIAQWTNKRNELQPDINDSDEKISEKKEEYTIWKACYPYCLGETLQKNSELINHFYENTVSLLSQNRKSISTFSDFFKSMLTLDSEKVVFNISVTNVENEQSAVFTINLDYIMNASLNAQRAYINFHQCWMDMKEIGINVLESPSPYEGIMHISLRSTCPQIITLFSEYNKIKKEKASPSFDEDTYNAKIKDIMRLFNVPIREYV